jgi:hypothetical protein|tara:strand:+ start:2008 stop:2505 length:498 start_codon:yes stop_codon:yes gene_type:complete
MFYLKDNFLSKDECEHLIQYYHNYPKDRLLNYNKNFVVRLCRRTTENLWFDDLIKYISKKCSHLCNEEIVCDNIEIVEWSVGSYMKPHKDGLDRCSAIIYLNTDFIGGETGIRFNDTNAQEITIQPKLGRLIAFTNGGDDGYFHWVNRVRESKRYTLSFWFVPPK